MPTVLQLSDLHAEPPGKLAYGRVDTGGILKKIRPWLLAQSKTVDAVVISGDLACDGDPEAYRLVRETFTGLSCPVLALPGNHDRRRMMRRVLGEFVPPTWEDERIDWTADIDGLRLIGLDTLQPGRHWGALPERTLDRLEEEILGGVLPPIIFEHHTPLVTGFTPMDEPFEGRERLGRILASRPGCVLATGHLHRSIHGVINGTMVAGCPSVALPIRLDFGVKEEQFFDGAPCYAMHCWTEAGGGRWVVHCEAIPAEGDGPHDFIGSVNPHAD